MRTLSRFIIAMSMALGLFVGQIVPAIARETESDHRPFVSGNAAFSFGDDERFSQTDQNSSTHEDGEEDEDKNDENEDGDRENEQEQEDGENEDNQDGSFGSSSANSSSSISSSSSQNSSSSSSVSSSSSSNSSSSLSSSSASTTFTSTIVATHHTSDDCWVIISGKVYNVTSYIPHHPGGPNQIISRCGTDATQAFAGVGHSSQAQQALASFYLGTLGQPVSFLSVHSGSSQSSAISSVQSTSTSSSLTSSDSSASNGTLASGSSSSKVAASDPLVAVESSISHQFQTFLLSTLGTLRAQLGAMLVTMANL